MSSPKNIELQKTSFLNKSNNVFIEQMYLKFINKDSNLPESWKKYFEGIGEEVDIIVKEINGPSWSPKKRIDVDEIKLSVKENISETTQKDLIRSNCDSIKAVSLIRSYRQRGHLIAKLYPIRFMKTE